MHTFLTNKYPWYQKWHEGKEHVTVHWVLMIVFSIFLAGAINSSASQLILNQNISYAASSTTLSGDLETLVFDDFNVDKEGNPSLDSKKWHATYEYYLNTDNGEKVQLVFPGGKGPDLLTHSKITVTGVREQGTLKVASAGKLDLKVNYRARPHHSPRKVAVIVMKWADNPVEPAILASIKQQIFTDPKSVNSYYRENSYNIRTLYGKNDINGDVYGYYTIPAGTSCGQGIVSIGNTAAAAAGVDLSGYDNYIYIWPYSTHCSWTGLASIGGNWAMAGAIGFNGSLRSSVIAHELGHDFGVDHANTLLCLDSSGLEVPISANCTSQEYQDFFEVMGNSGYYQMDSIHKQNLGWLQPSNLQVITASGDYSILPLDAYATGVQRLEVIPKSSGKTTPKSYFIDYRQPIGNFPINGGVLLHYGYSGDLATYLLDMTPSTVNNTINTDQGLGVGKTFSDPATGVSITVISANSSGAVIRVKYSSTEINNATCTITNVPGIVKPGSSFPVSMTIKNTGTAIWTLSDYRLNSIELSPALYAGQPRQIASSGTWGLSDINLPANVSAGQSITVSATLTAPTTTAAYMSDWRMKQYSQDQWFGVPCESIINVSDDIVPPAAPTNLTVTSSTSNSITLSWTAATDNVGVAGYKIYRQKSGGKTTAFSLVGYSFTNTYTDLNLSSATSYNYYVVAYDAVENNSSASNTVTGKTLSTTSSTSSLTLTMVTDKNGNGTPNWGDTITFVVQTTATLSPFVQLDCYQGTAYILSSSVGFFDAYPWPKQFTLSSSSWPSGGADCSARLYYSNSSGTKTTTLSTLNFKVDP